MEDIKKEEPEKKKIFFITSNQSKLDKLMEYQVRRNRGIINLKAGYTNSEFREEMKYKNSTFSVYINSVEIDPKDLKDEDREPQSNKYKAEIILKYNLKNFNSDAIFFQPSKNNFIFDFKFNEYRGWGKIYESPPQINFSLLDQFKLFIQYLKFQKRQQKDEIFSDLIIDSQKLCFGRKIYLDYYLEILKNCYSNKSVLIFLDSFKIGNILLPNNFDYKSYDLILKLIEKKPSIITQHLERDEEKNKYYLYFYTLLFFVRYNYDREKANEMLNNKNLWEYLIKILLNNSLYFQNLDIPKELFDKMFEQNLSVEIITNILRLCKTIEQMLILINDKIEIISVIFMKEKKLISMSGFEISKKNDNVEIIKREIEKIFAFQKNNNFLFILFDEKFWKNYIDFSDDVRKLIIINNIIILYSNLDENLKNLNLQKKIHQFGLDSINEGKLKNEELLYFIKNNIFFIDNNYENINDRPLDIVKGFDFDTMTEKFFEKWATSNIFNIYSFSGSEFKTRIVDKIEDIKNFGKLLHMFDYKNKDIFDNNLILKLCDKFKTLMDTYNSERCSKFIEDIAYFIYIFCN